MRVITDAVNKSIEEYITTKQVEKMISVLWFKAVPRICKSTTREMITSRMLMIITPMAIFPGLLSNSSFIV
jgi:hypothetical protein